MQPLQPVKDNTSMLYSMSHIWISKLLYHDMIQYRIIVQPYLKPLSENKHRHKHKTICKSDPANLNTLLLYKQTLNFLCDLRLKIFITSADVCKPLEYRVKKLWARYQLIFASRLQKPEDFREIIYLRLMKYKIMPQNIFSDYALYLQKTSNKNKIFKTSLLRYSLMLTIENMNENIHYSLICILRIKLHNIYSPPNELQRELSLLLHSLKVSQPLSLCNIHMCKSLQTYTHTHAYKHTVHFTHFYSARGI